ncbi:hypothetical protein QBC32DRAFT_35582 [Pseudoneurospora amorphoporcata]|uniref:Uncharacterized protein n=1 Tax=Pseudoneurospora amorphoporcata TaxID=241081 RepID=A0AAN6NPN8_9PEZI|nr:hypothetical protein QBC32DRAFT_35582 [Pseudoneurospora amorphoporcata]
MSSPRHRRSAQTPAPTTPTTLLNQKRASPTLSEPDSLITLPATIAQSFASRYTQIHNQQSSATRFPATGFQIQVDFNRGLWGFCGTAEGDVGRCWMPGVCYDQDNCQDGCGPSNNGQDLRTITCSSKDPSGASRCSSAYLTLDNNLGPFQYIACGWSVTKAHYTASQADAAGYIAATTTTTTTTFSSSSSYNPSSTDSTGSAPEAGNNNNSSSSDSGGSSNSNIGAIVGGVIGGLAVICAFAFAAWFVWVYRLRKDRRKSKHEPRGGGSEPLNRNGNGNGSGRSSQDDAQAGYGTPLVSMGEVEQRRIMKDAEGGWGPRELDCGGFGRDGYANEQQRQGKNEVYEVTTEEKAVEMPVAMERFELSSGWEDNNHNHHGRDGGGIGQGGTESNGGNTGRRYDA